MPLRQTPEQVEQELLRNLREQGIAAEISIRVRRLSNGYLVSSTIVGRGGDTDEGLALTAGGAYDRAQMRLKSFLKNVERSR